MYLEAAKELLQREYEFWREKIEVSHQHAFMEEKIRHSYQVLGAANFLIKHEDCFCDYSMEEKDQLRAIVLLHDIGRFKECIESFNGIKLDHGVWGAEFLAGKELFCNHEGLLAIKHHGHLIEELYQDKAYLCLTPVEKQKVCRISFLVRDADKLANFYLLSRKFNEIESVFFAESAFSYPFEKVISIEVLKDFYAHRSVTRGNVKNFADMALFFSAWVYDLNYHYSFIFMERLRIIDRMFIYFSKFWEKNDFFSFKQEITEYICFHCKLGKN